MPWRSLWTKRQKHVDSLWRFLFNKRNGQYMDNARRLNWWSTCETLRLALYLEKEEEMRQQTLYQIHCRCVKMYLYINYNIFEVHQFRCFIFLHCADMCDGVLSLHVGLARPTWHKGQNKMNKCKQIMYLSYWNRVKLDVSSRCSTFFNVFLSAGDLAPLDPSHCSWLHRLPQWAFCFSLPTPLYTLDFDLLRPHMCMDI